SLFYTTSLKHCARSIAAQKVSYNTKKEISLRCNGILPVRYVSCPPALFMDVKESINGSFYGGKVCKQCVAKWKTKSTTAYSSRCCKQMVESTFKSFASL
ncbi:MAG: hypothetical protein V1799_17555, partial [bacterium]